MSDNVENQAQGAARPQDAANSSPAPASVDDGMDVVDVEERKKESEVFEGDDAQSSSEDAGASTDPYVGALTKAMEKTMLQGDDDDEEEVRRPGKRLIKKTPTPKVSSKSLASKSRSSDSSSEEDDNETRPTKDCNGRIFNYTFKGPDGDSGPIANRPSYAYQDEVFELFYKLSAANIELTRAEWLEVYHMPDMLQFYADRFEAVLDKKRFQAKKRARIAVEEAEDAMIEALEPKKECCIRRCQFQHILELVKVKDEQGRSAYVCQAHEKEHNTKVKACISRARRAADKLG
jgi:hypothetical protein